VIDQASVNGGSQLAPWRVTGLADGVCHDVVKVDVAALYVADSPRTLGENLEHVRMLVSTPDELPPIIVNQATMCVIDGAHRLQAAKLRGDTRISVRYFSGDDGDAFVFAVASNTSHGLPLPLADRKKAAARIMASHQHWADRMIASVVGLSPGTISEIRHSLLEDAGTRVVRIGRDGRARPLDGAEGRMHAARLISENPTLSLRKVALAAGVSPETARDVKNRLLHGDGPLPKRYGGGKRSPEKRAVKYPSCSGDHLAARESRQLGDIPTMLQSLAADPAIRYSESGRSLVRLLRVHLMETKNLERAGANIPPHSRETILLLARECSRMWLDFTKQISAGSIDAD
jgi:ParB-like chromosome segregation protein Spo0J